MGMRINEDYEIEYYSDINGEKLNPLNMILANDELMSMEQFYKEYKIDTSPKVSDEEPCEYCKDTDGWLYYISEDDIYLCENCFEKWLEENEFITSESKICNYYEED